MRRFVLAIVAAGALFSGCGGVGDAPDVRGLALPDANERLEDAGLSSSVTSDALFGVIVEANYTVCDQDQPNGDLVPLRVSKQC